MRSEIVAPQKILEAVRIGDLGITAIPFGVLVERFDVLAAITQVATT